MTGSSEKCIGICQRYHYDREAVGETGCASKPFGGQGKRP